MSFLLTSDAMKQMLAQTGFSEVSWADKTEEGLTWLAERNSRLQTSPPLGTGVVMGPQFVEMAENLGRNLQTGRVRLVQAIVIRA
jgi:hypothetical protein